MAANRNLNCVGTASAKWLPVRGGVAPIALKQTPENPQTLARQGV
jgi:hypothetical protein